MIPVGKEMATHSSTLGWKIPWTEEPGRLQSMGLKESDSTKRLHFHFLLSCTGEGNGNLLQYFCLENHKGQELGGLPSMGSHRVGHDWSNLAAAAAMIPICYCQKFIATFTLKPFVIFCYWMKCVKCNISEPKKKKWICKRYRILSFWGENLCSWFSNSEWVW